MEMLLFPVSLPGLLLEPMLLCVLRGHILAGLLAVLLWVFTGDISPTVFMALRAVDALWAVNPGLPG